MLTPQKTIFYVAACSLLSLLCACNASKPTPEPTYSYLSKYFLEPKCALYTCHSPHHANQSGNLDLTAPAAYNQIVGRVSSVLPGRILVKPYDPDGSLLINRLEGTVVISTPLERRLVTPADIQLLRRWINDGANNN